MSRAPGGERTVLGRFDGEFADGRHYSDHEVTVAVETVEDRPDVYRVELAVDPVAAPERAVAADVPAATLLTVRGALADERGYARATLTGSYREGRQRTTDTVSLVARGADRGPAKLALTFDPTAATEKAVSVSIPASEPVPSLPDALADEVGERASGSS